MNLNSNLSFTILFKSFNNLMKLENIFKILFINSDFYIFKLEIQNIISEYTLHIYIYFFTKWEKVLNILMIYS